MLDIKDIKKQIKNITEEIDEAADEYDKAYEAYLDPIEKRTEKLKYKLNKAINDYLNAIYPGGQWEGCQSCGLGSLNIKVHYLDDQWYNENSFGTMSEGHSSIETLLESFVVGLPIKMKNAFWDTLLTGDL